MLIKDAVVLVTGASRGLGRVFVQAALARGARKVYAAARNPHGVAIEGAVPITLDVTRAADAAAAAALAPDVDLVINNAGISLPGGVTGVDGLRLLHQQLETNGWGLLNVAQAFAPVLQRRGGGGMVNMLSALSWVNAPSLGGYCVSKAAAWGLTNALRNELREQGTLVVGVHAGFIDTDMARGFAGPKTAPESVAAQVLDAVEAGQSEVLADEPARRSKAGLAAGAYLQALSFS